MIVHALGKQVFQELCQPGIVHMAEHMFHRSQMRMQDISLIHHLIIAHLLHYYPFEHLSPHGVHMHKVGAFRSRGSQPVQIPNADSVIKWEIFILAYVTLFLIAFKNVYIFNHRTIHVCWSIRLA